VRQDRGVYTVTINALIVDDEAPARDELAYLLASFPDMTTAQASSGRSGLERIRAGEADIVFLDIQMPGLDGFQVLEEALCLPRPPLFIIVTAYDRYAVRAFEENAVDYLLKPVTPDRLRISVERVRRLLADRPEKAQPELARLVDTRRAEAEAGAPAAHPAINRMTVEARGRVQLVDLADVVYCEKLDKRVIAYTVDDSFPVHGAASIDEVEERLGTRLFFRINRGTIVNLHRLREFSPWEGGRYCLVMDDGAGTELTLSRGRVRDFKQRLGI